jgi:hypothetical protein
MACRVWPSSASPTSRGGSDQRRQLAEQGRHVLRQPQHNLCIRLSIRSLGRAAHVHAGVR